MAAVLRNYGSVGVSIFVLHHLEEGGLALSKQLVIKEVRRVDEQPLLKVWIITGIIIRQLC